MANRGPRPFLIDEALEEAEEAEDAARRVVARIRAAMADGVVEDWELAEIAHEAATAVEEARDVVIATGRAGVAQEASLAMLRGGVTPRVARHAQDVGLVIEFPTVGPQQAA